MRIPFVVALGLLAAAGPGRAAPELTDPEAGLLELVTPPETAAQLDRVDGLAFDPFGNLFAALEIPGPRGGLVLVDVETGEVTDLGGGISRADQLRTTRSTSSISTATAARISSSISSSRPRGSRPGRSRPA